MTSTTGSNSILFQGSFRDIFCDPLIPRYVTASKLNIVLNFVSQQNTSIGHSRIDYSVHVHRSDCYFIQSVLYLFNDNE